MNLERGSSRERKDIGVGSQTRYAAGRSWHRYNLYTIFAYVDYIRRCEESNVIFIPLRGRIYLLTYV